MSSRKVRDKLVRKKYSYWEGGGDISSGRTGNSSREVKDKLVRNILTGRD